jgi:putative FmdB family regulatory protein
MPIYEFKCKQCGKDFEFLCVRSDEGAECPACGAKDVERLMSTFSCAGAGSPAGLDGSGASAGCSPSRGFS